MMNFSQQMLAVMHVIYIFRQYPPGSDDALRTKKQLRPLPDPPERWSRGDLRNLNESAVQDRAREELKDKGLTVSRQSWLGCEKATKGKKVIWHGIKRAMDGFDPLPEHIEIEEQIKCFGKTGDPAALKEENERLRAEMEKRDRAIRELEDGRRHFEEEFKNRAYTRQFIDGELLEELDHFRELFEASKAKLENEEQLRAKVDLANTRLRAEVEDLKAKAKGIGLVRLSEGKCKPPINLSPNLKDMLKSSKDPMRDYYDLRDEAWDELVDKAGKNNPDYLFLVFHKFNIEVQSFIGSKISPVIPASTSSIVFACYQPIESRRKTMYNKSRDLSKFPPIVFLVEGMMNTKVTDINAENRDLFEILHEQVCKESQGLKPKVQPSNPVREGYRQVWIERVTDEQP